MVPPDRAVPPAWAMLLSCEDDTPVPKPTTKVLILAPSSVETALTGLPLQFSLPSVISSTYFGLPGSTLTR